MFGIGMPEMIIILAVALIIFGPKRLPELAKSLGRALGEFKRATSDLKQSIETDTGLDEVRSSLNDVKKDIKSQVDITDSTPSSSTLSSNESRSDEPLSQVKAAFDKMNADTDPSPRPSAESEPGSETTHDSDSESVAAPAIDPDTKPQEKTTP
jgi:sec-independent protein translocase protein TatB